MNILEVLEHEELEEGAEVEPAALNVGDAPAPLVQDNIVQEYSLEPTQKIKLYKVENFNIFIKPALPE